MEKQIYQPIVIEKSQSIIDSLDEINFFTDNDIKDKSYAFSLFCENLTEKFIDGELDDEPVFFEEEEFENILNQIVVGSHLESLQKKGLVDFVLDENGEELFFLTSLGKTEAKKIIGKNS
jgi:hypothetical protein